MTRIPLHLQEQLRKATEMGSTIGVGSADSDMTNYNIDQNREVTTGRMGSDYRYPTGRAHGNTIFRRWNDGTLDVDSAASEAISLLAKVRNRVPVTDFEKIVLTAAFPGVFQFEDIVVAQKMLALQGSISVMEMQQIAMVVASRLAEEENFNGGYGGGTVAGRKISVG